MGDETVSVALYEDDIINFLDDERRPIEDRRPGQRRTESFADVVHRIIIELQGLREEQMKVRFDGDRS
jgi:hypothetical protein